MLYGRERIKKVNKVYTGIIDVNKVNTITLKYTRHEEPLVTDNSNIEVIKAPGYFKLFECNKKFFDNQDLTYKRVCMENEKGKYLGEMYYILTK